MKISQYVRTDNLITPVTLSVSGTTDSSTFYSLANYGAAEVLVTTATASGTYATVTVLKASDAAGTGKATTAVTATSTAPSGADKTTLHKLDATISDLDAAKYFVGIRVTTNDPTAVISAVILRYPGRYSDSTMSVS